MRLRGTEPISGIDNSTVLNFWSWAYSDVLMNAGRGVLAEYLVGAALNVVSGVRIEWDKYDIEYRGTGLEVKSAAYLQSWEQKRFSRIEFDIGPKRQLNVETNLYDTSRVRSASLYTFCLLTERDRGTVNPLDTKQWLFFVATKEQLNSFGEQQRMALSRIEKFAIECKYEQLRAVIDRLIDDKPNAIE